MSGAVGRVTERNTRKRHRHTHGKSIPADVLIYLISTEMERHGPTVAVCTAG